MVWLNYDKVFVHPTYLQMTVFRTLKGRQLNAKRPPFTMQKAAFCSVRDNVLSFPEIG